MYNNAPVAAPAPQRSDSTMAQKVRDTLKSLATSPLLIIAAACYTLLVVNLFLSDSLFDMSSIYQMFREMGIPYQDINAMMSGMYTYYTVGLIIGMIPSILIAIGMWVTVGSGANRRNRNMTTSGLTMIQVIQIIMTVLGGLAILLVLLALIMLSSFVTRYAEEASIILAICGAIIVAVGAFMIFYNVKIITTIGKIKKSIRTNTPNSKVGLFVAVMMIISGAFSALSFVTSLTSFVPTTVGILNLLYSLLSALFPILLAALLLTYRGRMRQLEYEEQSQYTPVYAPPAYNGYAGQPYAPAPQYMPVQPVQPVAPVVYTQQEAPVQPAEPEAPEA
jgi:MFS family permease